LSEYRDRNVGYVPEDLYLDGRPQRAEIGTRRDEETGVRTPESARVAFGLPDELNRKGHWWWADVSGDGSHWARFNGHRVQIDIAFRTENEREVNDWKGRDEIRSGGVWSLALNRQPCWEGFIGSDPLRELRRIPHIVEKMIDHPAICWFDEKSAAEQLAGRRVYYDRTPAVVSSVSVLDQGCVMLTPVGVDAFPISVHNLDEERDDDPYERHEIKVELLSPHVWWWRDRRYGDEPQPEPRPEAVPVPAEEVAD
jgi:hypothetical protein